jgi:hypothetical protein
MIMMMMRMMMKHAQRILRRWRTSRIASSICLLPCSMSWSTPSALCWIVSSCSSACATSTLICKKRERAVEKEDEADTNVVHELGKLSDVLLDTQNLLVPLLSLAVGQTRFLVAI